MTHTVTDQSATMQPLPPGLDSPQSKLVYLAVSTHEPVTPHELKSNLDLPLMAIFGVLRRLDTCGHVIADDGRYATA